MKKIIVPTDLSTAAGTAIMQAAKIAKKSGAKVVLLHVIADQSASEHESEQLMKTEAAGLLKKAGIKFEAQLKSGPVYEVISKEACSNDYDLMIIGTHGIKGVKQMFFGADILKLVSKISIPVMVLQENSVVSDTFEKVIFPVCSHHSFNLILKTLLPLFRTYKSEIHLYSINKAGFEFPEQMKKNIEEATRMFQAEDIKMIRVKEDQSMYSVGFAKQTLKYAQSVSADLICLMSVPSDEYYYFANADKEKMLENEFHIPVICAGGHC